MTHTTKRPVSQNPSNLPVGKYLTCGCCSDGFNIWEGYKDQGHDNHFGLCRSCQKSNEEENNAELDKAIPLLRKSLNPESARIYEELTLENQRLLAWDAIEGGLITFKVTA